MTDTMVQIRLLPTVEIQNTMRPEKGKVYDDNVTLPINYEASFVWSPAGAGLVPPKAEKSGHVEDGDMKPAPKEGGYGWYEIFRVCGKEDHHRKNLGEGTRYLVVKQHHGTTNNVFSLTVGNQGDWNQTCVSPWSNPVTAQTLVARVVKGKASLSANGKELCSFTLNSPNTVVTDATMMTSDHYFGAPGTFGKFTIREIVEQPGC